MKKIFAVFLDLKRAFETVNRKTELEVPVRWSGIQKQRIKFTNGVSNCLYVDHGVLQGTVLGPALFILYINDTETSIKHCDVMLFADDTML